MINFFHFFTSGIWVDYAIILAFVIVVLILISKFMGKGPKKILAIIGTLLLGGAAISWTARKNRYTAEKLRKHNKKIQNLLNQVEQREEQIKSNQTIIDQLSEERKRLLNSTQVDKKLIKENENKLNDLRKKHDQLKFNLIGKTGEINERIEKIKTEEPLPSAASYMTELEDIKKKFGLSPGNKTGPTVADPDEPAVLHNEIVIRGFRMKGDVL